MSKTTPTASSSSSPTLQGIFKDSLKEYQKKTEIRLGTHPLMAQLQACDSPDKILKLLRSQAAKVEETMDADDKLVKWLDPVVNVLSASSSVISAGVGLVNPIQMIVSTISSDIVFLGVLARECHFRRRWCPPFGSYHPGSPFLRVI